MLNGSLIQNARWHELYAFFLAGKPPLLLILVVMNTLFFVFKLIRQRKTKYRVSRSSALLSQMLLISANCFVMFHKDAIEGALNIKYLL